MVARAIHSASNRASKRRVVIDCGSLVSSLIESELFGHAKGAFSGAVTDKPGLLEIAHGGSAFLDEVGELALDMQTRLLRIIQEGEFRPVGAVQARRVDLRIIAATNKNLEAEVQAGRFRQDLFYRLNVFPIHVPPLRDRKEDIPLLVNHFLHELTHLHLAPASFTDEALDLLAKHSWPGNVRELMHFVHRAVALQAGGPVCVEELAAGLLRTDDAFQLSRSSLQSGIWEAARPGPEPPMTLREGEWRLISAALTAAGGSRAKAAELLGISRTTLYRRIKMHGIGLDLP
jgi:transcriptional regulator with GAF, ATPase, and Fis domain